LLDAFAYCEDGGVFSTHFGEKGNSVFAWFWVARRDGWVDGDEGYTKVVLKTFLKLTTKTTLGSRCGIGYFIRYGRKA
jgi:hypothetical protein